MINNQSNKLLLFLNIILIGILKSKKKAVFFGDHINEVIFVLLAAGTLIPLRILDSGENERA